MNDALMVLQTETQRPRLVTHLLYDGAGGNRAASSRVVHRLEEVALRCWEAWCGTLAVLDGSKVLLAHVSVMTNAWIAQARINLFPASAYRVCWCISIPRIGRSLHCALHVTIDTRRPQMQYVMHPLAHDHVRRHMRRITRVKLLEVVRNGLARHQPRALPQSTALADVTHFAVLVLGHVSVGGGRLTTVRPRIDLEVTLQFAHIILFGARPVSHLDAYVLHGEAGVHAVMRLLGGCSSLLKLGR